MLTKVLTRSCVVRHCMWNQLQRSTGVTAVVVQKASTATDPIQQLFVSKIREYAQKSKAAGGKLVDATPEQQKSLQDELEKIQRVYSAKGKDMTQFPVFSFTDPKLQPIDIEVGEVKLEEGIKNVPVEEEEDLTNVPYINY